MNPTKITLNDGGIGFEINSAELLKSVLKTIVKISLGNISPSDIIESTIDSFDIKDKKGKKAYRLIYNTLINTYSALLKSKKLNQVQINKLEKSISSSLDVSTDESIYISRNTFKNIQNESFVKLFQSQFHRFLMDIGEVDEALINAFPTTFHLEIMKEWNSNITEYKDLYSFFTENPFLESYEDTKTKKTIFSSKNKVSIDFDSLPKIDVVIKDNDSVIIEKINAFQNRTQHNTLKHILKKGEVFNFEILFEGLNFIKEVRINDYDLYREFEDENGEDKYRSINRMFDRIDTSVIQTFRENLHRVNIVFDSDNIDRYWYFLKGGSGVLAFYSDWRKFRLKKLILIYSNRFRKYGYMKANGQEVIFPKYRLANPLIEGRAVVGMNGKDIKEEMGIRKYFSSLKNNTMYFGYINSEGKEVISLKYERCSNFKNGIAEVRFRGKKIFIDKNGNELKIKV